jgi:probable F420-dependent oxidoreductase
MQFAITLGGGQVQHDQPGIEAIVEEVRLAEALGFAVAFVPDHYCFEVLGTLQSDAPAYELFFVMATLAQRTSTIKIGSHVACMLFRHPATTARLFAQIDEASRGRVIAGVGAGWTRAEFAMMGIEFPPVSERLRMLDEAVAVLRGLWAEGPLTFEGNYYRLRDAVCRPRPTQEPGPPIMLGGGGNGILRRAGQWADIVHLVPVIGAAGTTKLDELRKFTDAAVPAKLQRVRDAAVEAGRPPDAVQFATTIFNFAMTDCPEETRELVERMSGFFGLSPEEFYTHPIVLVGTPDEMAFELRRREETHGLSLLAINFSSREQIHDFGEQVLPRLVT